MKVIIYDFFLTSGQSMNFNKSGLFFSRNVDGITKEVVSEIMGIEERNQRSKYLGLPSLLGRRKNEVLGFIIKDEILGRIRN